MILHALLFISSLSFAADGSKYKGKTGRAAHESVNKSQDKNNSGGPPTPVTPTNGDKATPKAESTKPAEGGEEAKPAEEAAPTPPPAKKANKKKKKKGKKPAEKGGDNTLLFVGGGVLAVGAILALLLGGKKEEE